MGTPRVLLVQVLILAFLRTWASTLPMLTQLVPSNTKRTGNTAFLECQVNVTQFENVYIHWYRQQPGGPLIRILYLSSNENVIHEEGVNEERYEAKKRERDFSASLRIHQVTEADEGLYYCACWDGTLSQSHRDTEQKLSPCTDSYTWERQGSHIEIPPNWLVVSAQEVLLLCLCSTRS